MISSEILKQYEKLYSCDRLTSFIYNESDTIEDIENRYSENLLISQAFYPELSTLEVILRNSIDTVLKENFSKNWVEDEIRDNNFLDKSDYQLLLTAYNITKKECLSTSTQFKIGKVIANLNFGFWTNLCVKKYNSKIWNKRACFKGVFVNYPSNKQNISLISKKLYAIRKLRNRIFHYEQIFKYPEKSLKLYNDILEILSYLPKDNLSILSRTSKFLDVYNILIKKDKQKT